jgi:hypothetical protein
MQERMQDQENPVAVPDLGEFERLAEEIASGAEARLDRIAPSVEPGSQATGGAPSADIPIPKI